MAKGFRVNDTRKLGLVEIYLADGKAVLQLCPPGKDTVTLPLEADDARGLAAGLLAAADELTDA